MVHQQWSDPVFKKVDLRLRKPRFIECVLSDQLAAEQKDTDYHRQENEPI